MGTKLSQTMNNYKYDLEDKIENTVNNSIICWSGMASGPLISLTAAIFTRGNSAPTDVAFIAGVSVLTSAFFTAGAVKCWIDRRGAQRELDKIGSFDRFISSRSSPNSGPA